VVPAAGFVVLDTDVWSHLYVARRKIDARVSGWRDRLVGATVVVATQTRAEVLAGVYSSDWGQPRRDQVITQLDRTATVPVDERVVEQYAQLVASCKGSVTLWVRSSMRLTAGWAATAMALDVPLIAGDRIYIGTPGLRLMG
jgi:predicted nucleic acid-binding protein